MKKIFIAFILIGATIAVNAQSIWNVTYNMSVPLGSTKDFTDKASFKGMGIDGRKFLTDDITVGGSWNWNVFYERREQQLYDIADNVQIHGDQFRTGNYMPFMANAHYYLGEDGGIRVFAGTGVGTIWKEDVMQTGTFTTIYDNAWQFGLTPEVGVFVPVGSLGLVFLNVKYTYGVKTSKLEPTSYFNFGIGIGFENL